MVRLVCPWCRADMTAPDTVRAGDRVSCGCCGREFTVPPSAVVPTDVHAALRDEAEWEPLPEAAESPEAPPPKRSAGWLVAAAVALVLLVVAATVWLAGKP